jgi:hypothetical protein
MQNDVRGFVLSEKSEKMAGNLIDIFHKKNLINQKS